MSGWGQQQNHGAHDRNELLYGHTTSARAGHAAASTTHRGGGAYTVDSYADPQGAGLSDHRVAGMQSRVAALREITIGIGEEVRAQNRYLNEMNDDFDSTGSYMSGTIKRFQRMAARQRAGGWMCYMLLFVIGSFIFMYLYVKLWRGTA
ncbi:hypothetical protein THASP1DRAFT_30227 [Thamnocephalis sphaerospora]|uniref:t-SNARE coiled-coil homology domain-containing protein n=1 Tax=Thamnocephalis sphaerospora TaxID=78915 RepID=A0A4P9XRJ9_9FUNG|nr:hypothetical protein THASP1DRAFT_30227 [Thamnocephalis sphaerospora]|eukprot:RKP07950.1 hypothetical protein THASP1DRAFT_30227 [Thamnocephalis sphaerospora]